MDLTDLHVFRTVVEAGGVIRAAERLHRVPSNVTARIKKLEEDLGVVLFTRDGRRLKLSAEGQILLGYAERLLALAAEARAAMGDGRPRGTLRLGAMESTAAVRLPRPLSSFHERYPEVAVELSTGDPMTLIPLVLAGELDAALVLAPVEDPRLDTQPAFEEELVIVAEARHPPIASPADVQTRTLLAFHHGCPHRQRLEEWFATGGLPPERLVEVRSYHAILGCAVAGMGVALMPKSVLDSYAERARLSVHPLTGRFHATRTLLVWRRGSLPPKLRAFAGLLKES